MQAPHVCMQMGADLDALGFCLCCQQVCQPLHLCQIQLSRLQPHEKAMEMISRKEVTLRHPLPDVSLTLV